MSLTVQVLVMIGTAHVAANGNTDVAKCLREITNLEISVSPQDIDDCVRAIVAQGDPVFARELLATARKWASDLDVTTHDVEILAHDKSASRKKLRLNILMASPIEDVGSLVGDQTQLLELVTQLGGPSFAYPRTKVRCCEILARSQAPKHLRHQYIVRIIEAHRRSPHPPVSVLVDALDESAFPLLRQLVYRSAEPDSFEFCAAAVLAHLGDREILAYLEQCRPQFLQTNVNSEGTLRRFIWQIETQHPPAKLLAYMRSAGHGQHGGSLYVWAIARSVSLGLPKSQLRQAILAHATQVVPARHGTNAGWTNIKELGLDLGILRPGDLPSVKIPTLTPTP